MNIFKRCCLKGFGKWLRESDESVQWATNPFDTEEVMKMGDIEMMANNNNKKKEGMRKKEEEDEKDKNTRASDKYTRFMMENSALRAEMKRKDAVIEKNNFVIKIKDEEIKRLKILLLEVQS